MPVAYIVNEKGANEVRVRMAGYAKQRTTVTLCCTADGRKLPMYIIFKRKALPAREVVPKKVIVRAHKNGWMTSTMLEEWVRLA